MALVPGLSGAMLVALPCKILLLIANQVITPYVMDDSV